MPHFYYISTKTPYLSFDITNLVDNAVLNLEYIPPFPPKIVCHIDFIQCILLLNTLLWRETAEMMPTRIYDVSLCNNLCAKLQEVRLSQIESRCHSTSEAGGD